MYFRSVWAWICGRRPRTFVLTMIVAHTVGFLSSLDALMSTRTAPGAVAWIVSLNTFPVVAVPSYWVFGRSRFQGYVIGRREDESELYHELAPHMANIYVFHAQDHSRNVSVEAIEKLAKMPILGANDVELLIDGEATFKSIFDGIERAKESVLVQFYIVRDDNIGRALQALLIRKAREGVRVHFLYDEVGSYRLPTSYLDKLTEAGVEVRRFHSTRGSGNRFQLNFRNHRKVVVVDGHEGWVGGLNAGDEYLGRSEHFGAWRDTHLRVAGPATLCLQLSFVEDWNWASGEILDLDWEPVPAQSDSHVPVLILPSGPADPFETASLMIQHASASAQDRLWISSPYFVPDEGVLSALKLATLRGVDVRVLIPERTDNILTYFAAYALVGPLLKAGVQIYRYQDGFLHGKSILIDDVASAVGTVNLDNRSFRLNFELTAWVIDEDFAQRMQEMFVEDFSHSRAMTVAEVEEKPWWFRAASRAAYLTAPVL